MQDDELKQYARTRFIVLKCMATNLKEKIQNISRAKRRRTTNLQSIFDLILKVTVESNTKEDDMLFQTCSSIKLP